MRTAARTGARARLEQPICGGEAGGVGQQGQVAGLGRDGNSLRGLAAQVYYDGGGLSKIVSGQRRCPPNLARLIDGTLGAGARVTAS